LAQEGASVGCDIRSSETSVWMFCGIAVLTFICGYRCDSCELEALDYRG
jgi:hypothetical protein